MSQESSLNLDARRRRNGVARRERTLPQVNGARRSQDRRRSEPARTSGLDRFQSLNSPEARQALLQSGSGRKTDRLAVTYHSTDVDIELTAGGTPLLAGPIEAELSIDGLPVLPRGDWQSVCWHSDDDGDYLELQLCLGDSVRIDRQLLLSRRGRFALLADAVFAPQANRIESRLSLKAAEGVAMKFNSTTREARLRAAGCTARVFPLALPQDRVVSTAGGCLEQGGRLELSHVAAGGSVFTPLLLDWHPQRTSARAEWRSLTVSELGKAVAADRAAGHRLRLGKHQLLIYRSLANTDEARAVLGHHTRYESVVATFDAAGNVKPVVMVERE